MEIFVSAQSQVTARSEAGTTPTSARCKDNRSSVRRSWSMRSFCIEEPFRVAAPYPGYANSPATTA
ncbi:hypothetical protein GCM10009416_26560 [Craurococcus roseus]|uniref:Uncharacterized protein n=1 Tax=Craurococcus roseus TaxID=77585 RepID=A0ABN1FAW0_9PROT